MDKLTQKWAIIALLEDAAEGSEYYFTDFPLHVTLAGVFASDKTGNELAAGLAKVVANVHATEIVATEQDLFGAARDIAVMRIAQTPELLNLYATVFDWLESESVAYNEPQYQGEGYIPHSTLQKSSTLSPGERRILRTVSLIDLFPNGDGYQRKIFKTINLQ